MSQHTDTERDEQLLAQLDPETAKLLFPERFAAPIEVTLVCPSLDAESAAALASVAVDARATIEPDGSQRLTFPLTELQSLYDAYTLLEQKTGPLDVLIDGKRVPMVRELWLPLLWGLLS